MINKIAQLRSNNGLMKYARNTSWLLADKIIRMGVGLFVGVWIARYLGPEQFGLWSYSIAFAALFSAFATLGLDGIVIRELIKHPNIRNELLGSVFRLKLLGGIVALVLALSAITLMHPADPLTKWLVAISATGFIFQSFNVIDFYFQAHVKSRYTVYAANAAFLMITMVKIVLLMTGAPLIDFAWAGLGEIILTALFFTTAYKVNHLSILGWKYHQRIAKILLKSSAPLLLSSMAVMLYMRLDQVMLGEMIGSREVGLFSAALRISEVWYFIPMAIVGSVFPAIIAAKKRDAKLYLVRIQKLYDVMTWLGISIAVITTFLSGWIVNTLYGAAYAQSATILSIQIWAGIGVSMGFVHGKWLLAENLQRYSLVYTALALSVNVSANLILIPRYGANGAAVSTLLAQLAPLFVQYFIKRARPNLYMMLESFTAPIRRLR